MILILSSSFIYSQKHTEVKLVKKKQPVIIISGKNKTYYKLSKRNFMEFSVDGADKLIIYSRKRIDTKDNPDPYTIKYKFDNSEDLIYKSGIIEIDPNAAYINKSLKKRPALFYKKIITVPENSEKLYLLLEKSNDEADITVIAFYNSEKKKLIPTNNPEKNLIKSGKRLKYYKLNSVIPTIVNINDPGKLIVYSRKRLTENNKKGYSFSYKDKNANKRIIRVDSPKLSLSAVYKSFNIDQIPSGYTKTVIDIPNRYGELIFSSDFPVDARFLFMKDDKKTIWKDISSINKSESIILQYKESETERKYYRISEDQTFSFNVTGPKKIRILSRGEYHYDMHSNNDYEIILKKGTEVINTYKLSCFRSSKVEYKDNDEMIPGTLDRIYIDIPEGEHTYTLSVNNNNKTALIRVSAAVNK